jgi:FkbM family methyltransferase
MENFFDKSVHYLGRNQQDTFVINIGAMDGVLFDELIGYTNTYGFRGLYVEPIDYLFKKLQNNLGVEKNQFENSAISDYDGKITMMTIDQTVIDSGLVHNCFYGMSAIVPAKNGLGSEFDRPTVEKYGKLVEVDCIKLETLFNKHNVSKVDVIKIDAEGHDYTIFKQIDFKKYRPKVIRLEWINLEEAEQYLIKKTFEKENYVYEISGQDIVGITEEMFMDISSNNSVKNIVTPIAPAVQHVTPEKKSEKNVTIVTGLWDIGRKNLSDGWARTYNHYLEKFEQLLALPNNMIIFGDAELKEFVFKKRNIENTQFILRDQTWFVNNDFYHKIQKIRINPDWYNQVGWLKDSTQAKLEMYNPLVMSKMFLLHDAKILDKFDSEYLFWLDAGITNTVHQGYFTHDLVLDKIPNITDKFMFICFPYETSTEIHGFKFDEICKFSQAKVDRVARGGFFGGKKETISEMNNTYYNLLHSSLDKNLLGTEESLFTIMTYLLPDKIDVFNIEFTGLLGKFFEDLKNNKHEKRQEAQFDPSLFLDKLLDTPKETESKTTEEVALYVIGFNSPNQFKTLIHSMMFYDKNFIDKTKKYLLDNSTDLSTTEQYVALCKSYGFEHIKKDNIGITGGRQWIAEHFNESNHQYYMFFEDDMFFHSDRVGICRNGFNRYVPNLYDKVVSIVKKENFDFLKFNFSEFFGDNGTQWSWYNVPQVVRDEYFPNNPKLPTQGLDPNAPRTEFKNIRSVDGLSYITGDIYYSNWPQIMSKQGNRKCFIDTKFQFPYEQTIMSFIFQETKKGLIKPGILLLTPTEHNRFDHYEASLRKEC